MSVIVQSHRREAALLQQTLPSAIVPTWVDPCSVRLGENQPKLVRPGATRPDFVVSLGHG